MDKNDVFRVPAYGKLIIVSANDDQVKFKNEHGMIRGVDRSEWDTWVQRKKVIPEEDYAEEIQKEYEDGEVNP